MLRKKGLPQQVPNVVHQLDRIMNMKIQAVLRALLQHPLQHMDLQEDNCIVGIPSELQNTTGKEKKQLDDYALPLRARVGNALDNVAADVHYVASNWPQIAPLLNGSSPQIFTDTIIHMHAIRDGCQDIVAPTCIDLVTELGHDGDICVMHKKPHVRVH